MSIKGAAFLVCLLFQVAALQCKEARSLGKSLGRFQYISHPHHGNGSEVRREPPCVPMRQKPNGVVGTWDGRPARTIGIYKIKEWRQEEDHPGYSNSVTHGSQNNLPTGSVSNEDQGYLHSSGQNINSYDGRSENERTSSPTNSQFNTRHPPNNMKEKQPYESGHSNGENQGFPKFDNQGHLTNKEPTQFTEISDGIRKDDFPDQGTKSKHQNKHVNEFIDNERGPRPTKSQSSTETSYPGNTWQDKEHDIFSDYENEKQGFSTNFNSQETPTGVEHKGFHGKVNKNTNEYLPPQRWTGTDDYPGRFENERHESQIGSHQKGLKINGGVSNTERRRPTKEPNFNYQNNVNNYSKKNDFSRESHQNTYVLGTFEKNDGFRENLGTNGYDAYPYRDSVNKYPHNNIWDESVADVSYPTYSPNNVAKGNDRPYNSRRGVYDDHSSRGKQGLPSHFGQDTMAIPGIYNNRGTGIVVDNINKNAGPKKVSNQYGTQVSDDTPNYSQYSDTGEWNAMNSSPNSGFDSDQNSNNYNEWPTAYSTGDSQYEHFNKNEGSASKIKGKDTQFQEGDQLGGYDDRAAGNGSGRNNGSYKNKTNKNQRSIVEAVVTSGDSITRMENVDRDGVLLTSQKKIERSNRTNIRWNAAKNINLHAVMNKKQLNGQPQTVVQKYDTTVDLNGPIPYHDQKEIEDLKNNLKQLHEQIHSR